MTRIARVYKHATTIRKTLGSIPGAAALYFFFSSDPAVSSSIFVGAEREENLITSQCVLLDTDDSIGQQVGVIAAAEVITLFASSVLQ